MTATRKQEAGGDARVPLQSGKSIGPMAGEDAHTPAALSGVLDGARHGFTLHYRRF